MDYDNQSRGALVPKKRGFIESPDFSVSFVLSGEMIAAYLQKKSQAGVAKSAIQKYKGSLKKLLECLPEEKQVTKEQLIAWRKCLEDSGYSKVTVCGHVKVINDFLRTEGYPSLCIPKPLRLDVQGQTFGYLTAIEPTHKRCHREIVWRCQCKCGNEIELPATLLVSGNTTSCGCLSAEILKDANRYVEGTSIRQSLKDEPKSSRAVSGYTGVQLKRNKWVAYITYKKVKYHLGTYEKLEDAVKARSRAKQLVIENARELCEKYDLQQMYMQTGE